MAWFRRLILWAVDFLLGRWIRRRPTRAEMGTYYYAMLDLLREGDVILCRRRWNPTNLFIPGYWKHAAMYVGLRVTVEALGSGVQRTSLAELLDRVDEVAIVRPWSLSPSDASYGAGVMQSLVGAAYDLDFAWGNDAFYCSEAIVYSYLQADPNFRFVQRSIMGVDTIVPDDFYRAGEHFEIVFDSRSW